MKILHNSWSQIVRLIGLYFLEHVYVNVNNVFMDMCACARMRESVCV